MAYHGDNSLLVRSRFRDLGGAGLEEDIGGQEVNRLP